MEIRSTNTTCCRFKSNFNFKEANYWPVFCHSCHTCCPGSSSPRPRWRAPRCSGSSSWCCRNSSRWWCRTPAWCPWRRGSRPSWSSGTSPDPPCPRSEVWSSFRPAQLCGSWSQCLNCVKMFQKDKEGSEVRHRRAIFASREKSPVSRK